MPSRNEPTEVAPPDVIRKIVEGFQYEAQVKIPGPNGESYVANIGVLWDDEIRAIQRDIGQRINPIDYVARDLESRFETIVRATLSITSPDGGETWEVITDDEEDTRLRRQQLRGLYGRMPRTVEYLYTKYKELVKKRDEDFDQALELIKKSSRMPDVPEKIAENLPGNS